MRTKLITAALALGTAILLLAAIPVSIGVQVPIPTTPAQVPGPVPGNKMTTAYVQFIGRMAYIWGYPLVNAHNRRAAFAEAPAPGLLGGVVPVAPIGYNAMLTNYVQPNQTFIVCPNQDVAYGAGFTALDKEPVVVQVPDFGDRFYVYAVYDQRTDEIAQIGKQYGTKPGFYLIVASNWKGNVPDGISAVVRSSTDLVFFVPRVFKEDTPEDTKAVQPLINQVMMYPLGKFDGTMKTTDYSKLPHFPVPVPKGNAPKGESKWVNPGTYYEELPVVMKEVPPLPGEEALYRWIWLRVFFTPSERSQAAGRNYLERQRARKENRDPLPNEKVAPAQLAALQKWGAPATNPHAYLKKIPQPTLVVNGSNDVIIYTVNSYILQQHLPDAQLILYPDSSHGSQYQYPELFVEQPTRHRLRPTLHPLSARLSF